MSEQLHQLIFIFHSMPASVCTPPLDSGCRVCFLQTTYSWADLLVQSDSLNLYVHGLMAFTFKANIERSLMTRHLLVIFLIGWLIACSFVFPSLVMGVLLVRCVGHDGFSSSSPFFICSFLSLILFQSSLMEPVFYHLCVQ